MATQVKVLAFGGIASITAWCASVKYHRDRAMPQGRRRQFTPGSPLDIASEKLKTGDVVLFSRDCGLYYPCGAVHCEMTKATTAEWTPSGIKVRVGLDHLDQQSKIELNKNGDCSNVPQVRPFDERVMCSLAFQIVVLPLAKRLPKTSEESIRSFVAEEERKRALLRCYGDMLADLAMQTKGKDASPSIQFVRNALLAGDVSTGGSRSDYSSIKYWSDGLGHQNTGGLQGFTQPFSSSPIWFRNQK